MGKKLLEVLNENHTCNWQKLEEKDGEILLVCTNPECGKTKKVKKPTVAESSNGKKVLFG